LDYRNAGSFCFTIYGRLYTIRFIFLCFQYLKIIEL
jgi:hypothetical protein